MQFPTGCCLHKRLLASLTEFRANWSTICLFLVSSSWPKTNTVYSSYLSTKDWTVLFFFIFRLCVEASRAPVRDELLVCTFCILVPSNTSLCKMVSKKAHLIQLLINLVLFFPADYSLIDCVILGCRLVKDLRGAIRKSYISVVWKSFLKDGWYPCLNVE